MSRKTLIKIGALAIAAVGIFFVSHIVRLLSGEAGTAENVSFLQKVYQKGGTQVAATFTNSPIQKFPFSGPINWRLQYLKAPCMILTGKVDTNALRQFIDAHPATQFYWNGVGTNGENNFETGWPDTNAYPTTSWQNMSFQTDSTVGGNQAVIKCWMDFPACNVTIQSWGSD